MSIRFSFVWSLSVFIVCAFLFGCSTKTKKHPICKPNPYDYGTKSWYAWEDENYAISCAERKPAPQFFNQGNNDPENLRMNYGQVDIDS